MKNTRRNFFRNAVSLLALAALHPTQLFAHPEFPDVENGVVLRKIYRNGKRIRMCDLRKGDVFEMADEDRRWTCVADSNPFKTPVAIGDSRTTWTVSGRTLN